MSTAIHDVEEDTFVAQSDAAVDFLSHYGVKGMKWGRRKSGSVREAPSEDAERVGGIHSRVKQQKSTKPLSNKELQDAIKRMQLEQQYSQLSGGLDKTRRQKASQFISEMVTGAGKNGIQQIANEESKKQFKTAFESAKTAGAKS